MFYVSIEKIIALPNESVMNQPYWNYDWGPGQKLANVHQGFGGTSQGHDL